MKKNKMMRIASVLLVAVLLSTCAISGTFAKYTSAGSVTATATLATWDIKLEGSAIANDVAFNLVDTTTWTNTNETAGAAPTVTTDKIAPGTSGSGKVVLKNDSEVAAEIVVTPDVIGKPTNMTITYTYANTNGDSGTVSGSGSTTIAIGIGETVTITVNWEWPFNGGAADDTDFAGEDITVNLGFVVSQVD